MMVDIHMKDGRTTFRFLRRGLAIRAMKRQVLDLGTGEHTSSVRCWASWRSGEPFVPARVQAISPNSVSMVIEVPPERREAFLAEHDPDGTLAQPEEALAG